MPSHLPPPSSLQPGSVVDAYVRDSGGPRQDASTDQQIAEIAAYCKQYGLILRHKFVDAARSGGSTVGREAFNQMVDATRRPEDRPNGLLLWNYARFARDLDDAIYYKALLRNRNVIVHSLTDPIPEGQYGRIIEFFVDISNEEKRRQTSADAKRGLRDLVLKHGCVPGTPPAGFMRVPVTIGTRRDGTPRIANRWMPDPQHAHRIKQAFTMRAEGKSLAQIHAALRIYSAINSYKTFFTNRIYIGILEFSDLIMENYCEPLVDIDTWNAVQGIVKSYSQNRLDRLHPRRTHSPYFLSGMVYCDQCGSPMSANTVTGSERHRNEAYRCSRSKRRAGCDATRIGRKKLEDAVLHTLRNYILLPEVLEAMANIEDTNHARRGQVIQQRLGDLQADRRKIAAQIANLTRAIADRGHSHALLDKLNDLEASQAQISVEINQLNERVPGQPAPMDLAEIQQLSAYLGDMIEKNPPDQVRQALSKFIQKVSVRKTETGDLAGMIVFYVPRKDTVPPFEFPPSAGKGSVNLPLPLGSPPLGAQLYRQTFSHPIVCPSTKTRSK